MSTSRFRRHPEGIEVSFPDDEQQILTHVLGQLRDLLMAEDPHTRRLRPPARPDDPEAEASYQEMVGDQLLAQRLEAIEAVEGEVAGAVLDDDAVGRWMQTLNGLRLVLGERLEIDHDDEPHEVDDDDPDAIAWGLYNWLSNLLGHLVEVAEQRL